MGKLVRRFATRVILFHLLALLAIIALVFGAAHQVYHDTRERILGQAISRQQLIAGQTSRAVADFFDGIMSNLDLVRRSEGSQPMGPWEIRGRRFTFAAPPPPPDGTRMEMRVFEQSSESTSSFHNPATRPFPPTPPNVPAPGVNPSEPSQGAQEPRFRPSNPNRVGGQPFDRDRLGERLAENDARLVTRASAEILWRQLDTRATHLFSYLPSNHSYQEFGHSEQAVDIAKVVEAFKPFLTTVAVPEVSPAKTIDGVQLVAACAPVIAPDGRKRVLTAIIPVSEITQRFLQELGANRMLYYAVYDSADGIIATSDQRIPRVSKSMISSIATPRAEVPLRSATTQSSRSTPTTVPTTQPHEDPKIVTYVMEQPFKAGNVTIDSGIAVLADIDMEGSDWRFVLASPLSEVDSVVASVFHKVVFWSAFLVLATAGLLISTSTQLIRDRVRLERQQQAAMERDFHQARKIQLEWLPDKFPTSSSLDVAAVNVPASHVSGDLYNWFQINSRKMAFVIGDVTGHGLSAAMQMSSVQLLVRAALRSGVEAGHALSEVNATLCLHDFKGQFVTLLIAVLDTHSGELELATAGHPYPILGRSGQFTSVALEPELMLGIDRTVEYPTQRLQLTPGDTLIFYTDGLPEASSMDGEIYSLSQVLLTLSSESASSSEQMLQRLVNGVKRHIGEGHLLDDLTAMIIRWHGAPSPSERKLTSASTEAYKVNS